MGHPCTSSAAFPPHLLRYHGDIASRDAAIDFAVNVRGQMPHWLKDALIASVDELATYPDPGLDADVRAALADIHGVSADHILLLSGAAEGFSFLPHLLDDAGSKPPRPPAIVYPQFTEPEVALSDAGVDVQRLILPQPWELAVGIDRVCGTGADCGHSAPGSPPAPYPMMVVGNPTNPTGVVHSRESVLALRAYTDLLVVDEAFMDVISPHDFPDHHNPSVAGAGPGVVVLRSMTKTWALAGLRCGYAVGEPAVVAQLAARRPAWPMGTMQMRAMLAIANHGPAQLPAIQAEIRAERADMASLLDAAGWHLAAGVGPFILAAPPVTDTDAARQYLGDRGISVRRCDTFPGLDSSWWRLAVRESGQVRTLVATVEEFAKFEKTGR